MYHDEADRIHPRSRVRWDGNFRSCNLAAIWDDDIRMTVATRMDAGKLEAQADDTSDYELCEPMDVVASEIVRSVSRQVR